MATQNGRTPNRMLDVSKSGSLPAGSDSWDVLASLQRQFGAVRYTDQQMLRYPYYSAVSYPAAGAAEIPFWGTNMGGSSSLITNTEMAGGLGNFSFLLTGIYFDYFLSAPAQAQPNTYTTDASAFYSDVVHGLFQAGAWQLTIGNVIWDQQPIPFLTRPPSNGRARCEVGQGAFSLTQSGMTPFGVTGTQNVLAYADLNRRTMRRGNLQNPLFIAPQQNFTGSIGYPSGLIPIISTGVVTGGATLYLICVFDGWKFTPVG